MLPNADRAVVDIAKLRDYCLNPDHEDGNTQDASLCVGFGSSTRRRGLVGGSSTRSRSERASDHDLEEPLWNPVRDRLFVEDFIKICNRSELLDRQDRRRLPKADDVLRQDLNKFYGTDCLAFVSRTNR